MLALFALLQDIEWAFISWVKTLRSEGGGEGFPPRSNLSAAAAISTTSFVAILTTAWAIWMTFGFFCNIERIWAQKVFPLLVAVFVGTRVFLTAYHPTLLNSHQTIASEILAYIHLQSPMASLLLGDLVGLLGMAFVAHRVLDFLRSLQFTTSKKIVNVVAGSTVLPILKILPFVSGRIEQEMKKTENTIRYMLKGDDLVGKRLTVLPAKGRADEEILNEMRAATQVEDKKWKEGYCSGAVYHGETDHLRVLNEAYALFSVSNPLHPDIWPSIRKYEAEVISMTASLLNGGNEQVCGVMTSGGTESILLAMKSHRSWFRAKGIDKPEIIAPVTAHAAIDKACDILKIKLIKVPVDPITFKVDVGYVRRAISANTILLYASAPNFPQGIIDDIEELSRVAQRYDVGLHVDCCLGGFFLPFARKAGYDVPKFDFELPGVTSMSCDTHKYGYASKGTSIVLYANEKLRRHQYFAFPEWTGGLYITPTIAGSRAGGLSAAAWAALVRMGEEGFMQRTTEIMETARKIRDGIDAIPGLYILGDPKAMIVCFGSTDFNILLVGNEMSSKGWSLNSLQYPTCIHLCVTIRQVGKEGKFLDDLRASVDQVLLDPLCKASGGAAIYGLATSLPPGPVDDILRTYTDITLEA